MKKYRVTKSDGTKVIIEANNLEDAVSKARAQFGKLPNDINKEIMSEVSAVLKALNSELIETNTHVLDSKKSLCWDEAYSKVKNISKSLVDAAETISQKAGSMVKIKRQN